MGILLLLFGWLALVFMEKFALFAFIPTDSSLFKSLLWVEAQLKIQALPLHPLQSRGTHRCSEALVIIQYMYIASHLRCWTLRLQLSLGLAFSFSVHVSTDLSSQEFLKYCCESVTQQRATCISFQWVCPMPEIRWFEFHLFALVSSMTWASQEIPNSCLESCF